MPKKDGINDKIEANIKKLESMVAHIDPKIKETFLSDLHALSPLEQEQMKSYTHLNVLLKSRDKMSNGEFIASVINLFSYLQCTTLLCAYSEAVESDNFLMTLLENVNGARIRVEETTLQMQNEIIKYSEGKKK